MALRHWEPKPLPAPIVDLDLPRLSLLERAAEVLRFSIARFEYWLSPRGNLREFIKLNLRLAIAIALPVLTIGPLVTYALEQCRRWISLLTESTSSFVLFPLSVLLCILLVCGMIYIGRSILEMKWRAARRDHYY